MFINFKSYQKSIQFYRSCQELKMPYHLKEQLNRASASANWILPVSWPIEQSDLI